MSGLQQSISVLLTLDQSWYSRYWIESILILVIVVLGVSAGLLWRRLRMMLAVTSVQPAEDASGECPESETPHDTEEAVPDGPGPILVRLAELCQEFESTTRDVRQYSGTREMQLQSWQRQCADILRRVLPVLDNIEPFLNDENTQVAELAQLIQGRLMTELLTVGVRLVTPEPGEPFNAAYHQLHPDTDALPPYQVKSVVTPGFLFHSRVPGASDVLLKPAEVIAETIVEQEPAPLTEPETLEPAPSSDAEQMAVAEIDEEETIDAPPLGGYDVLITPLPLDEIDAVEDDLPSDEPATRDAAPQDAIEEETPSNLWMDETQDHRVWVVDDGDDSVDKSLEAGDSRM